MKIPSTPHVVGVGASRIGSLNSPSKKRSEWEYLKKKEGKRNG